MPGSDDIKTLDFWVKRLGLLPVPLFRDEDQVHHVLLNGQRGNFCLSFAEKEESENSRSQSWSSDVGHYVQIQSDFTLIRRWDELSARRISNDRIAREPERFHSLLEKEQPLRERSVVAKLMTIFRDLRAGLGPEIKGPDALGAFLCLLACAQSKVPLYELDADAWHLDHTAVGVAKQLDDPTWSALLEIAMLGDRYLDLEAQFDLVLRHASGQLFQEAHYQAVFDHPEQRVLGGFLPKPVRPTSISDYKGLHFTPPSLARTIVEESIGVLSNTRKDHAKRITIFDPACGSGEFLREAIRLLQLSHYRGEAVVIGWDISEAAARTSKFVLGWEARNLGFKVSLDISARNSLIEKKWPAADLLLTNPPFVSWEDMNKDERDIVVGLLGSSSKLRPDLASAFLLKSVESLKPGGIIGTVLPASILSSKTAASLRDRLAEQISLEMIARLGSQQLFSDAIVDPAFLVAAKGKILAPGGLALWADHRTESSSAVLRSLRRIRHLGPVGDQPILGNGFSIYRRPDLGQSSDTWVPRRYEAWKALEQTQHLHRVREVFDVRQGIRTGANDVFLLSDDELRSLPARERRYFRSAVVNSSIKRNFLNLSMHVFYPYGRFDIPTEDELRRQLPIYYSKRLKPAQRLLENRAGINKIKWWELTRHRAWQIEEQPKLVSTYFGDTGSFAIDVRGDSVVVQGYAWFPKGMYKGIFLQGVVLAYLAVLASSPTSQLIAAVSNHVGGGQWDLSTRFVEQLPVPEFLSSAFDPGLYSELVKAGEAISRGDEFPRSQLDELARAAYGLI